MPVMLEVRGISKTFEGTYVLRDTSFDVARGETLCLLGPSGCGKTTLLRVIAGLERPDCGTLRLEGVDLSHRPVHARGLGFMFQEYALFPHKTVYGNVAFGLRMARRSRDEVARRVKDVLALVGLQGFEGRSVHELSGGEQQRVALARSLAPQPRLLMLDEPLASLDRALRERLMNELRQILKVVGVTALYVTHDQSEAFALGDRVAVMRAGHIEQIGPPEDVYRQPVNVFVARFLGMENLMPGQVVDAAAGRVRTALGKLTSLDRLERDRKMTSSGQAGEKVTVLLRPEAARLVSGQEDAGAVNLLRGEVVTRSFRGAYYRLVVRHAGGIELAFEVEGSEDAVPDAGQAVTLSLRPQAIRLLKAKPTQADDEVAREIFETGS